MGNPEILAHASATPIEPPHLRVLWIVYRLRNQGQKLARRDVLRTGQIGLLELRQESDGLGARLIDPSGYPALNSMFKVQVIRHDARGLLLHGSILSVRSGATRELPQAWWCQVASAEPA